MARPPRPRSVPAAPTVLRGATGSSRHVWSSAARSDQDRRAANPRKNYGGHRPLSPVCSVVTDFTVVFPAGGLRGCWQFLNADRRRMDGQQTL
jgi:hypothetical protein